MSLIYWVFVHYLEQSNTKEVSFDLKIKLFYIRIGLFSVKKSKIISLPVNDNNHHIKVPNTVHLSCCWIQKQFCHIVSHCQC